MLVKAASILPKVNFLSKGILGICAQASMSSAVTQNQKRHNFKGKVAVVTASTEGIGFAIAEHLAQNGASVVISSRRKAKVDAAYLKLKGQGLDVCATVCHVGEEKDRTKLIEFAIKEKGGIDMLVSNAAVNPYVGSMLEASELVWDKIFDINVKAAFLLTKEIVPHMEKRGGGSVVLISSIGGFQAMPMLGIYSVSKTALLGLTRALSLECASMNIRVNSVCPGVIETNFSNFLQSDESMKSVIEAQTTLKRFGKPGEVAPMVSFLLSDEASYITGENMVVSGGLFARL